MTNEFYGFSYQTWLIVGIIGRCVYLFSFRYASKGGDVSWLIDWNDNFRIQLELKNTGWAKGLLNLMDQLHIFESLYSQKLRRQQQDQADRDRKAEEEKQQHEQADHERKAKEDQQRQKSRQKRPSKPPPIDLSDPAVMSFYATFHETLNVMQQSRQAEWIAAEEYITPLFKSDPSFGELRRAILIMLHPDTPDSPMSEEERTVLFQIFHPFLEEEKSNSKRRKAA